MFDIKTLSVVETAEYHIKDAAGNEVYDAENNPLTITVVSPGTKKYRQAKHNYDEKKSNSVVAQMTGQNDKRSYQDDANDRAEFFANLVVSFNGFQYGDRQGFEAYKAFFADPKLYFIADDFDRFMAKAGNFKPDSATALPSA